MAGGPSTHVAVTRRRDRVAHYRVLASLGEGGMGVVHLAEDEVLSRRVALKLLAPGLAASSEFRERFMRESRLAASIEHPNIVPIYEAGESRGTLYIAMRYIEGGDLRRLLAEEGALGPERALVLLDQVAGALDAAHDVNLVHRDVKPANVMIDRAGGEHCYLTDFGLTKDVSATSGFTATGQFLGTLNYVAPEQLQGGAVSSAVDTYALGCVLFECLAGSVPFQADNEVALMFAHMHRPPPSLRAACPALPEGINHVIARALAKDPADRHSTCRELIADARAALDGAAVAPFEPSRRSTPRFARAAAAAPIEPPPDVPAPRRAARESVPPVTPLIVGMSPQPPRAEPQRHMRAAAIVAIAILVTAAGIAAALVLGRGRRSASTAAAGTPPARRIINRTTALNTQLKQQVTRLKQGTVRRDAALRARLLADERQARALAAQARREQSIRARIRIKLIRADDDLAKASRTLANRVAAGGALHITVVNVTLADATDSIDQARSQMTAGTPQSVPAPAPSTSATKAIELPSGAQARITGDTVNAVHDAGDVNGDGTDDIAVEGGQASYVLYGGRDLGSVDLSSLGPDQGFKVGGAQSLRGVGDVDGDGIADVAAVGAPDPSGAPAIFVIPGGSSEQSFSLKSAPSGVTELALPAQEGGDPEDGFSVTGATSAGDVNNDGVDDLLIGDPLSAGGGAAWVVYGGPGLSSGISLDSLASDQGFKISSTGEPVGVGGTWSNAGDLNGDGFDDVIVGAAHADGDRGAAYVVYGSDTASDVDVNQLDPRTGFTIHGSTRGSEAGASLTALDDFDGGGNPEVVVGEPGASPNGRNKAGAAYVVRGGAGDVDLASPGDRAIEIDGASPAASPDAQTSGSVGSAAAPAGDLNGDRSTDLILSAAGLSDPSAAAYVVYGGSGNVDLADPGDRALPLEFPHQATSGALGVGGGGDVTGDGNNDVLAVLGGQPDNEADVASLTGGGTP